MTKQKQKTLILIDGHALAHRAFHAIPPLTAQGRLVHAVFGFSSILLRILKEFKPEYIACAFDLAAPTFRHKQYKEYKATRVKVSEDFYNQLPDIKNIVKTFSIPIYEKEGFEADDVIGSINKLAIQESIQKKIDLEVFIVTGDLDTLQLVTPKTKIYTLRKSIKDTIIYDEKAVKDRFGLIPEQMNDFKGLKGDPSDNIIGVPGIGEKTATTIISKYNTLEKLYEKIEELDEIGANKTKEIPASAFKKLLENKDQAFFSRELATINIEVPLDFKLSDTATSNYNKSAVEDIFKKFNFFSLIKRLPENRNEEYRHPELVSGSHVGSIVPKGCGTIMQKRAKGLHSPKGTMEPTDKNEMLNQVQHDNTQNSNDKAKEMLVKIDELREQEIFSEGIARLEKEIIPVLQEIHHNGIKIDIALLKKLSIKFAKELSELEKKIWKESETEFNINSPQQLSEILFTKLKIKTEGLKKTPGGVISTAAPELEKLKEEHAIIKLISEYRELAKLKSTYIDALPKAADANQRVHTTFHQIGTSTGRLSSSDPNLQNIPTKTKNGQDIRRAFIAEPKFEIIKADYSQLELRIVASMANDEKMLKIFAKGGDIHKATAAEVAEIPIEDVSFELRNAAKALNFGIIYGMSARGFASSAGINLEKAKKFIEAYLADFKEVAAYMEKTKEFARKHGFVQTLFGRRRYIPELRSESIRIQRSGERMAINMPIQGTAADIVKMAMLKIHKELKEDLQKDNLRILLQVHDELVFEIKKEKIEELVPKIKKIMENIYSLPAKLEVDIKTGDNWQDTESCSL